jgi:hypothetical protein
VNARPEFRPDVRELVHVRPSRADGCLTAREDKASAARLRRLGRPAAPPCSFPPQQAAPPCLVPRKVIPAWRNRLDITFSDITVQMGLARHGAHAFWDLLARTAATTARTLLRVCLSYE